MHSLSPQTKQILKRVSIGVGIVVVLFIFYIYVIKQPSNSRSWEFGYEILPHFTIVDTAVSIENVRDNQYVKGTEFKKHFIRRDINTRNISKVWFVVSKFSGFGGIAHTYFIFDMNDSEPITVSVEARREKGEDYSIPGGIFNRFEIMYVWATDQDSLIRRSLVNKDKVYMYPLEIPQESSEKLFLQLAHRSQDLETMPRFYNTLWTNCTNELADVANEIKPGTVPFNLSLFLPGYSATELHKLGYISGSGSIEEIEKKHYITDFVSKHYTDSDFSQELRESLQ